MPEASFKEALLQHLDPLYHLGLALTRNPKDAEDLTQETLLKALKNRHLFRKGTNLKAWLFTILRNTHINRYRRERLAPNTMDFTEAEPFVAGREVAEHSFVLDGTRLGELSEGLDDQVKQAVDELSEEFREVFLLATVEDLAYKEIAQIVGIPIGTVMSRLFRARKQLQQRLSDYARDELGIAVTEVLADASTGGGEAAAEGASSQPA